MTQPNLVSIILSAQVPTWFEHSLQSALAQQYPYCEILIVDSSGDKFIRDIVQPYLEQPGFIIRHLIYERNDQNILASAIREAKGKYLKFLTDAELLAPNCISTLVPLLENHSDCMVAATKRTRIDAHAKPLQDLIATAAFLSRDSIVKGKDFLRYQTMLHYSLIGELTASLLRRDDVLRLMPDDAELFVVNGERLFEVDALIIYCQLLEKGDLIYLTNSLCFIRVSTIYSQPQQREGSDLVKKNREIVFDNVRRKPWFNESDAPKNMVLAAPLSDSKNFKAENISALQYENLNLNAFRSWLDERTLQPFQQRYLQQLADANPSPTTVAVVIKVNDENHVQLPLTLASLTHQATSNIRLLPILVGKFSDNYSEIANYNFNDQDLVSVVNKVINQHDANWFIFVDAGCEFQPSGLIALSSSLPQADSLLAVYADEFFYIDSKPIGIAFRPDFNLDMLLSSPKTMSQHWLYRRELLLAAEGLDANFNSAAEFDLIIKLIESQGPDAIGHLAEPLLTAKLKKRDMVEDASIIKRHLQNRGYPHAQIAVDKYYNYRLRYEHSASPKISIAILANWHLPSLASCITTLLEKTSYLNYELLIIADNQCSHERDNWLTSISQVDAQRIRVLPYDDTYNHALMANTAAQAASGEYVLFIHCELAIMDSDWLDNLVNHAQRPEVGIVGGKQLTTQNKIRNAGYILGMNGAVGEPFRGHDDSQPSYLGRLHLDQNVSAISGEFMMVRKTLFDELGGFDSHHLLYDDVDFCLRARNLGYMCVWTPYSRLLRPAARGNPFPGQTVHNSAKLKQLEEDKLYKSWMPIIGHDPAFNANLSSKSRHFDVSSDSLLSWNPVRREKLPVYSVHNADFFGCGYYRMITPLEAMQNEGVAEGKAHNILLGMRELEQFKPDTLIVQRRYSEPFQHWASRIRKLSNVFTVYELDDYILNVPLKNHHSRDFKAEINKQLRKTLTYFDRFVVSTAPLAEALSDMHPEIVVVNNKLPVNWWGNLLSLRQQGKKPRVGWAGGSSHTGDLEMIVDVVKEFADKVEWVFLGMCPAKLRPYVHEIHYGVDITLYPAKLASLNLDLALAPVEDNIFNTCKSNLRLMEYGACGIPVICSDVECYRGDLPVTRIRNRFIDWRDAIQMHLNDPDASARMGEALQLAIRRDWMLTGDNVREWSKAWSAN